MKIPRRSSIRAGGLRQRITVQSPVLARDATGGFAESWSAGQEFWAFVEPLRGQEQFGDDLIEARQQWRVLVRGEVEPTVRDRIVYEGRVLGIVSVLDPDQRGVIREIRCQEGVDADVAPPVPPLPVFASLTAVFTVPAAA